MPELSVLIILAVWFLIVFSKRLKAKKGDIEVVLFVVVSVFFLVVEILELAVLDPVILRGVLYGGFALSLWLFNAADFRSEGRSSDKVKAVKKDLRSLKTSFESLRKRFIALIALLKEGLTFKTDDGEMFGTDVFLKLTGLKENEFSQQDFVDNIHPDDVGGYEATLSKLSKKKPDYDMTYRYKKNNKYVWLKERGSKIFYESRQMVVGVVQSIDVKMFPETEVDMLNNMKIDQALMEYLQSLNRIKLRYHLIVFELSNIPAINARYGRDIGDLMMGEFLHKLKYNFLKDEMSIFRLTGIRFAMVLKDDRKYQILERALKHGGELLNIEMRFGSVKQSVYPYFGIGYVKDFDEPLDAVIQRSQKALTIAMREDNHENYFIIG